VIDQVPPEFWRQLLERQQALLQELQALRQAQSDQTAQLKAQEQRLLELRVLIDRQTGFHRAMMVSGRTAADGRDADPLSLTRAYAQVYSQNGEDGMTSEIFRRIGVQDRFFVEIGIENGLQCNTRLLLEAGWRGVWLEGSEKKAREARQYFRSFLESGSLKIAVSIIGPENIETILDQMGVPARFDYLSLDIDQHTHNVWRAMKREARVACIEYNASVPPSMAIEVPFDPTKFWDGSNWYGAGLKTLELIGAAKHMRLVGCDLVGVNAFFVTADEAEGRFRSPFTAETHYQPASYRLVAHAGHPAARDARHWVRSPEAMPLDPFPKPSSQGTP
jgi:hypothetical protein